MMLPPAPEGLAARLVPLYDEAAAVADPSPASACALLRLLIRAVLVDAGRPGRDLRRDLEAVGGLAPSLLRALDTVELSADQARHPGVIDLAQGPSELQQLAGFVHVLVGHVRSA